MYYLVLCPNCGDKTDIEIGQEADEINEEEPCSNCLAVLSVSLVAKVKEIRYCGICSKSIHECDCAASGRR